VNYYYYYYHYYYEVSDYNDYSEDFKEQVQKMILGKEISKTYGSHVLMPFDVYEGIVLEVGFYAADDQHEGNAIMANKIAV